jgi:hypothetical protein
VTERPFGSGTPHDKLTGRHADISGALGYSGNPAVTKGRTGDSVVKRLCENADIGQSPRRRSGNFHGRNAIGPFESEFSELWQSRARRKKHDYVESFTSLFQTRPFDRHCAHEHARILTGEGVKRVPVSKRVTIVSRPSGVIGAEASRCLTGIPSGAGFNKHKPPFDLMQIE